MGTDVRFYYVDAFDLVAPGAQAHGPGIRTVVLQKERRPRRSSRVFQNNRKLGTAR